MSDNADAFWLCHECGAQMRPITRNGTPHCASCDGEFLEILDSNVNPDPFHELPPPPPIRPQSPSDRHTRPLSPDSPGAGAPGGFMQSLLSGLFGAAAHPEESDGQHHASNPQRSGNNAGSGTGGGRSFTFNVGGGRGQVMFGSFNGGGGGDGGLESFFPGFAPPPGSGNTRNHPHAMGPEGRLLGHNDPMGPEDLIRALFSIIAEDGNAPAIAGQPGRGNLGDYVMTDQGFDQILEQLMHAAGPQGPIPATDVVIQGLPRSTFTEESLEKSPFKDCPVCKDDFVVGDEIMRIPCQHVFHPDCLQPWLRVNGSCPVCRFSLVPEDGDHQSPTAAPTPQSPPNGTGQSTVTNILQRLWGQGGTNNPASPSTEVPPPPSNSTSPQHSTSNTTDPSSGPDSSPMPSDPEAPSSLSSAIPDDYRARHRQREQQQQQQQHEPIHEDLDSVVQ